MNCPFNCDARDKYIMGTVSLLFVNKQSVSWSIACEFKIDMFLAPWYDDTEQFVKFHHYTFGSPESMGLSTLHLRTLYIENHGPVKLLTYMYIMVSTVKNTLESTVV